jgi:hypothetical protein
MAGISDGECQSLAEIAEYHNDTVDALAFFLQALWEQKYPRFVGYSLAKFEDLLQNRIRETDLRSSFAILAAIEAALRNDYEFRATKRRKDALSKAFREIYKKKPKKVRFDEDLLDLWVQHYPGLRKVVGELRGALDFRHWLAHGRSWDRPVHGRFDFFNIYNLAATLFAEFEFVLKPPTC